MSISLITEPLGLYGWVSLEPIILAALLSEEPLLLVGEHGSAKSFLLERLAQSLNMQFRSYNASLLNYDDLVGIPMPDADHQSLHFISSPDSIWDAEVVFLDEINRTRPDLQNKLFPIIHERRVQGHNLEHLKYRWAAMNPPLLDDEDAILYVGAEPLDIALADRFTYIVSVPNWDNLSPENQNALLLDQYTGRHEFSISILELIAQAKQEYDYLVRSQALQIVPYITILVNRLRASHYDVSTRRSTMLHRSLLAIHAARVVLARLTHQNEPELYGSAQMAIQNTLPDRARRTLNSVELIKISKQCWDIAQMNEDNAMKLLLAEPNPTKQLYMVLHHPDSFNEQTLAQIIGQGIGKIDMTFRKMWALITYLKLRNISTLPASCIELLVHEIKDLFDLNAHSVTFKGTSISNLNAYIRQLIRSVNEHYPNDKELQNYHENLLLSYLNHATSQDNINEISNQFVSLWNELHIQ